MDLEQLAKTMRERALLIEGDDSLSETLAIDAVKVARAKESKQKQLENFRKLYFNAGRWVGGDRDWTARQAHLALQKRLDR